MLLTWNRQSNYPFVSAMLLSAYIPPSVGRLNVSNKQPVWFKSKPVCQIVSNQSMISCYVLNFSGFSAAISPVNNYVCWEVARDKNRLPDSCCTKNPVIFQLVMFAVICINNIYNNNNNNNNNSLIQYLELSSMCSVRENVYI